MLTRPGAPEMLAHADLTQQNEVSMISDQSGFGIGGGVALCVGNLC